MFQAIDESERYYFHVDEGSSVTVVKEGRDFTSVQEALEHAMALADELAAQALGRRRTVVVEGEDGDEIARVLVGTTNN